MNLRAGNGSRREKHLSPRLGADKIHGEETIQQWRNRFFFVGGKANLLLAMLMGDDEDVSLRFNNCPVSGVEECNLR